MGRVGGEMSRNNRRRWIAPWKNSLVKPEIYHTCGRVVGWSFLLGEDEREHFRMLMRMCEKFTGCRVLSYILMSNHFHILLEVTRFLRVGLRMRYCLSGWVFVLGRHHPRVTCGNGGGWVGAGAGGVLSRAQSLVAVWRRGSRDSAGRGGACGANPGSIYAEDA